MRASSLFAASFCTIVAAPSACVIENNAPTYKPPPPRPVVSVPPTSASAPPPVASPPAEVAPPPAPPLAAADPPPAPAIPPDFTACKVDADCVVVPRNSCCNNGFREAISGAKVDAYKASFVCPTPGGPCPMFRIRDNRTAACGATSHQCELVGTR
jgi:hypothetical protein